MSHSILGIRGRPLLLCLCAFIGFAGLSPAAFAADKPKQEISRVIAKEITGAQKAMQANQWSEALKNLEAAETKSPLSTYDKKTIAEFKGICYVRLNNLKAAQTAYEQALATGGYSADELPKTYRLLIQLAATNKSDAKAIEYGKQASEAGSATDDDLLIMSQLYYQQKDCKNSGVWGDKAIAAFKKAGQQPKEVLYQLKLQCASDANDTAGMKAGLYDLIRLTNKTSYWNNLIRLERQDERDDNNTRMIYRIMFDTPPEDDASIPIPRRREPSTLELMGERARTAAWTTKSCSLLDFGSSSRRAPRSSSASTSLPLGEDAARQSTSTSPFLTDTRLSGVAPRKTEPLLLIAKAVESGLSAMSLLRTTEAGTLPRKVRATARESTTFLSSSLEMESIAPWASESHLVWDGRLLALFRAGRGATSSVRPGPSVSRGSSHLRRPR